ncbi:MAG: MotA/TolQ/ExbB proton channel family protein [Gammaproteobacteria bacterium]|nr:MotA/TolQ/ExbB proton channel family protein [Gammaproteobacteria bacterium]
MLEYIKAGGWMMFPIIVASIIAVAIILERFWSLRRSRIVPKHLLAQIYHLHKRGRLDYQAITQLKDASPLGRVLAAGLTNANHSREVMKEALEETGRHVVHELERYLSTLGSIAAVSPLLGLLGTVYGMISTFTVISSRGVGDPTAVAAGISEALICTATGLTVAIPALLFHRHFQRRIEELVVLMEQNALKLVEVMHGERDVTEEFEKNEP